MWQTTPFDENSKSTYRTQRRDDNCLYLTCALQSIFVSTITGRFGRHLCSGHMLMHAIALSYDPFRSDGDYFDKFWQVCGLWAWIDGTKVSFWYHERLCACFWYRKASLTVDRRRYKNRGTLLYQIRTLLSIYTFYQSFLDNFKLHSYPSKCFAAGTDFQVN